ncbi:MAG: AMP-binding protein, partial [Candidatus Rokuibacteriota bacterium]
MDARAFTVYDLLVRGASLYGDAPALIQSARQWSFRDLLERADRLAAGLAGLGLSKGDRICILAQNDAGYVDLYGACARQGIIAYPINWRLTAPEVERVL